MEIEVDVVGLPDQHTTVTMDFVEDEQGLDIKKNNPSQMVNGVSAQCVRLSKRIVLSLTKPSYTLGLGFKNVRRENRARLSCLLRKLVRQHNWEEASAVLSTLLKGTCKERSPQNNRMKYWVAMELLQHMEHDHAYSRQIKHIYDIWMKKVGSTKNRPFKDSYVQLEFIIFCLRQGNLEDAHQAAVCLMQEHDSASNPICNLILGLTFFELWYSTLPRDMQLRNLDESCMSMVSEPLRTDCHESVESLEGPDAVSIDQTYSHLHCHSETSVMNMNINTDVEDDPNQEVPGIHVNSHGEKTHRQSQTQGLDPDFLETSEQEGSLPHDDVKLDCTSVFYVRGLESLLLPLRLPLSDENMEDFISFYGGFFNNHYKDALHYLQLAVNSVPPVSEALLPLIQLLLLGDQVKEALIVLKKFCHTSNTALPFRLRAHLLECFASNSHGELSTCYEAVLKIDPTSKHSIGRLINLYRIGEYNPEQLVEMIALHLDATCADYNIWKEFSSCLLKLSESEEDRMSMCLAGEETENEQQANTICFSRVPTVFTKGMSGKTWKFRCKWWLNHHFSKDILTSEIAVGELWLMTYKAACATHFYGREFDYVMKVLVLLEEEEDRSMLLVLQIHMQKSTGFCSNPFNKPVGRSSTGCPTRSSWQYHRPRQRSSRPTNCPSGFPSQPRYSEIIRSGPVWMSREAYWS
ncbi:hypothetical protein Nepgr_002539 [Nepenthes gracilis]|uniref:Uncharacterized protein n=1 Tax=Nepenthes gracilis TaxID=150966 RepID=A0AAD3P814_NEPGR|nr:hypothetical protein Nepgr_002539 [Nepenthes gracilis]